MRAVLVLLSILAFTSTQVMALTCGASCSVQEKMENSANEHDCCPHSKKKQEKKSHCHDSSEICLHDSASTDLVTEKVEKSLNQVITFIELPVAIKIATVGINERYRPEIPTDQYFQFKTQLRLYILKDQFLI